MQEVYPISIYVRHMYVWLRTLDSGSNCPTLAGSWFNTIFQCHHLTYKFTFICVTLDQSESRDTAKLAAATGFLPINGLKVQPTDRPTDRPTATAATTIKNLGIQKNCMPKR